MNPIVTRLLVSTSEATYCSYKVGACRQNHEC